ncbi:hypothetical protein N2152v2_003052 [Parachlorella kessleri]
MQIFIKCLAGTRVLEVAPSLMVDDVKAALQEKEGIPAEEQRLLYGSKQLVNGRTLGECSVAAESTLHLVLRLRGGKGGFGSLLRGAGKQKLTDNFDACRDLQGRRIRHKTAEQKLAEWAAQARERELEKVAVKHIKEQAKAAQREEMLQVDVDSVRRLQKDNLEDVLDAVQSGLASAGPGGVAVAKRQAGPAGNGEKRRRIDPLLLDDSDLEAESDEEESEGNGEGVVAEAGGQAVEGSRLEQSTTQQELQLGEEEDREQDGGGAPLQGPAEDGSTRSTEAEQQQQQQPEVAASVEAAEDIAPEQEAAQHAAVAADHAMEAHVSPASKEQAQPAEQQGSQMEQGQAAGSDSAPLDLAGYSSAEELEALGLDRLKAELARLGLKCGGSLKQRAERLFLLKATPLEKLDRKHFAAAAPKA